MRKAGATLLLALTAVAAVAVARASFEGGSETAAPLQGAAAVRSAQEHGIDIAAAIGAVSRRIEQRRGALGAEGRVHNAARPLTTDWVVSPEYPSSNPVDVPSRALPGQRRRGLRRHQLPRRLGRTVALIPTTASTTQYSDIYAMRVSQDGVCSIPTGFRSLLRVSRSKMPAVAFGAGNYFVTWTEGDFGGRDIKGARVTPRRRGARPGRHRDLGRQRRPGAVRGHLRRRELRGGVGGRARCFQTTCTRRV